MSTKLKSYISFIFASLFFTSASSIIKYNDLYNGLDISYIRFLVGFLFYAFFIFFTKHKVKVIGFKYVIYRGIFNSLAVLFFYQSIMLTTVAEGNVLNMTFPIFIALLAPFMLGEHLNWKKRFLVFAGFFGIYLVVNPRFGFFQIGHFYGLLSGIAAAVALIYLRAARRIGADIVSILFFVNVVGLATLVLIKRSLFVPWDFYNMFLALASAISAMLGQVLITYGYRYADAATGGLFLISRIPMALLVSIFLFGTAFSWLLLLGILIVFGVLVGLAKIDQE